MINKKEEKFKAYLRKEEELWKNHVAQRNLGYKPLDTPIHKGYDAVFILRDDIARRDDADEFEALIHYYGKSAWCRDKTFTKWDRTEKRKIDIKPYFKKIDEDEYERLLPWCKKFFTHSLVDDRTSWGGSIRKSFKINVPEFYFKMKIENHYETHYKVIDEILLQEEAEIEEHLWGTFYNERIIKWNSHRSSKSGRKLFNRAFRTYNKSAIKNNVKFMFNDIDEDHGEIWNDEVVSLKYNHRHSVKWDW